MGRISGPLLDRFDLRVEVPSVSVEDLAMPATGEASAAVAGRVARARAIQRERFDGLEGIAVNADAEGDLLETICEAEPAAAGLLRDIAERFQPQRAQLSPGAARGAHHRRSGGERAGRPPSYRRSRRLSSGVLALANRAGIG